MHATALLNSFRLPITTLTCHQQHQHWHHVIRRQEEEIRQLGALLLDVMNQNNCRSLRHDAIDYYRELNHLQTKLDRLHRDLICEGGHCAPVQSNPSCADARFGLSETIEHHTTALVGEFACIQAGCLQFLSAMMSLNLL